jgi:iron complex transport system substrate-binding protein
MQRTRWALAVGAVALLAACGSSGSPNGGGAAPGSTAAATTPATTTPAVTTTAPPETTTTAAAATFPVTVSTPSGPVTIAEKPTKIVSLSPTATEMLFAIGAGPQVVAVDEQSTYPAEAPKTDLSGFTPNLEAIVKYEPDLVVVSNDLGNIVAGLNTAKVPVMVLPAATTIDDTYRQLELLGAATGNVGGAAEEVSKVKTGIEQLVAKVPERAKPLTYYHELDDTFYTATSTTFIGSIYAMAGLQNIADAADKDGSGYPQLSAEYIIQQNPDMVFLADTKCCNQSATTVAARPGWAAMSAVKDGGVIGVDDDLASRWGPRVVDFLQVVVDAVNKVPATTG